MRYSRYINIDSNTLLEYIYDDSNLIGEPYNILYNTQTGFKCFVSTDELVPPIKGYKQTNNDAYNHLYPIGQSVYSRLPSIGSNRISGDYPSLQLKNFATSIPIRYDKIRIHLPVNYTFGDMKGFYLRVYTFDFNNNKIIELTNYHFNITDVEQNYKLEYSTPMLYVNENQWGKYLEVQIPSVTKVSDQRINDVTRSNSINYNLTDGLGLSKTSPIFIEFRNIESINKINNTNFYQLSTQKTVVVPQTPEFEKLGIRIEESKQGDFFLIYGTYNGSLAEFQTFINESYYQGLRYQVRYIVDIIEETIKTKTYTFSVTEDINEEIEFRPILKYTTTTAIIDVTLRLINIIDDTFIERKASFGLLQGGGQRMGAQPNGKLTTGNNSGGGGDISKYASSLTKINLRKSKKPEVIKYKSVTQAAVGSDAFGTKALLTLEKIPFVLFSKHHNVIDDISTHQVDNVVYVGNNQLKIDIDPFDNLFKFKIYKFVNDEYINWNLLDLTDVKLTIKGDKKDLDFNVYRDSAENDFENGVIIFRISEGSYKDVKKISSKGYNLFYINGIDVFSNRQIVYSGFFKPYDSKSNIESLESEFENNLSVSPIVFQPNPSSDDQNSVNDALNNNTDNQNSVNTSTSTSADNVNSVNQFLIFKPRFRAADLSIATGLSAQRSPSINKLRETKAGTWSDPVNGETMVDNLTDSGIIVQQSQAGNGSYTFTDIETYGGYTLFESYVRGYFKGLNILPTYAVLATWKNTKIYFDDLKSYIDGKKFKNNEVIAGEFLPTASIDRKYFDQNNIPKFYERPITPMPNINQVAGKSPSAGLVAGAEGGARGGGVSGVSTNVVDGGTSTGISEVAMASDFNPLLYDFDSKVGLSNYRQITKGQDCDQNLDQIITKGTGITTELSYSGKSFVISDNLVKYGKEITLSAAIRIQNGSKDWDAEVYAAFAYYKVGSSGGWTDFGVSTLGAAGSSGYKAIISKGGDNYKTLTMFPIVLNSEGWRLQENDIFVENTSIFTPGTAITVSLYSDSHNIIYFHPGTYLQITGNKNPRTLLGSRRGGMKFAILGGTVIEGDLFKGIIRESGTPIPGVQVTLSSLEGYFSDRTIQTNSDGIFDFGNANLVPGDIKLRMLKTGYATKELEITTTTDASALLTEEGSSTDAEKIIGISMTKNA